MIGVLKPVKGKIILSILGVILFWILRWISPTGVLCAFSRPCIEIQKYPHIFGYVTTCGCSLQPLSGLIGEVTSLIIVFALVYLAYSIVQFAIKKFKGN